MNHLLERNFTSNTAEQAELVSQLKKLILQNNEGNNTALLNGIIVTIPAGQTSGTGYQQQSHAETAAQSLVDKIAKLTLSSQAGQAISATEQDIPTQEESHPDIESQSDTVSSKSETSEEPESITENFGVNSSEFSEKLLKFMQGEAVKVNSQDQYSNIDLTKAILQHFSKEEMALMAAGGMQETLTQLAMAVEMKKHFEGKEPLEALASLLTKG